MKNNINFQLQRRTYIGLHEEPKRMNENKKKHKHT